MASIIIFHAISFRLVAMRLCVVVLQARLFELRDSELSRTRPPYLSTEHDA